MQSRTSRYTPSDNIASKPTRMKKNNYLYDDLNKKIGVEEYVDINTQTRIDLMSIEQETKSRENYHQLKDYQNIMGSKNEADDKIPTLKEPEPEKIYNINDILEEARKNRQKDYDMEAKRKLDNEEYNVLSDLNKKYLTGEDKEEQYEGLQELIDSITTKVPIEEINKENDSKDLLSDLMETSAISTDIPVSDNDTEDKKDKDILNSFYTKSMDLSSNDFFDEEEPNERKGKRVFLIIVVALVLILLIATVAYFILPMII